MSARLVSFSPHPPSPASHRRSDTFSHWNVEWRSLSKVVKWVFLGDNPPPQNPSSESTHASYSALSPSASTTCVDLTYDDGPLLYTRSELGHGVGIAQPEVQFPSALQISPQDDNVRRFGSFQTSRHKSHVQGMHGIPYTSVERAVSEQGHCEMYRSHFDALDTFPDVDHSATFHESNFWSRPRHVGHTGGFEAMRPSGYPSALSLSNGYDSFSGSSAANLRPFKSFRSVQSALALPVSSTPHSSPQSDHRRPRKLRKSLRAAPTAQAHTSRPPTGYSAVQPASYGPPASQSSFYGAALTAPLVPPKPVPRSPRKLTKRPSSGLPHLPKVDSSELPDIPPPLPPKPTSILMNKLKTSSTPPSTSSQSQSSSHGITPLALTDTSVSTSNDDEPLVSQGSAASSGDLDGGQPSKRPSLLRTESNRRWTVAVADVPDDLFLEELERLRRMGLRAGEVHGVQDTWSQHIQPVNALAVATSEKSRFAEQSKVLVQELGVDDEMDWLHARRAIFCCRELVRTERSYQARLQELADYSVSDTVPMLLVQYLPALISASKILSAAFNEDMSAPGVSSAFINTELTLESAFVAWSGVVGEFFGGKRGFPSIMKRKRESTVPVIVSEVGHSASELGEVKSRRTSMHGHGEYVEHAAAATSHVSRTMNATSNTHWLFRPAFSQTPTDAPDERESFAGVRRSVIRRETRLREEQEKRRKPPFRDLAILPTQRVTRYVLLYKDLLKHTPSSSPSRELIERAVDSAMRIAQKCDRAQDNSAFLYHG